MRVIAGDLRSRRLKSIPGLDVRPTPDRLREALFNVLSAKIAGSVFLDAYAGTGAVGIEALSRGAARAIFIEKNRIAVSVIRENLASLQLTGRSQVISGSAERMLPKYPADICFLDPPYQLDAEYSSALGALGADPPRLVIAQHASRFTLHSQYGTLVRYRVLRHGDNSLSFFAPE